MAAIHQIGARCYIRLKGAKPGSGWFDGRVVGNNPLRAVITTEDKIWRGCEVTVNQASIRVHPNTWPDVEEERFAS